MTPNEKRGAELPGYPEKWKLVDNGHAIEFAGIKYHPRDTIMVEWVRAKALSAYWEAVARKAVAQLHYFVKAKRYDRQVFDDDTAMLDWALNRAGHVIAAIGPLPPSNTEA